MIKILPTSNNFVINFKQNPNKYQINNHSFNNASINTRQDFCTVETCNNNLHNYPLCYNNTIYPDSKIKALSLKLNNKDTKILFNNDGSQTIIRTLPNGLEKSTFFDNKGNTYVCQEINKNQRRQIKINSSGKITKDFIFNSQK